MYMQYRVRTLEFYVLVPKKICCLPRKWAAEKFVAYAVLYK